ncbi:uncharacterized protein I206_104033 [Kwoniella pini CBS 10737]|uniref:DNA recombination and repair protein Rad51-like C-terminal domain-containing protein n=1 Tax=Kwoniella pini CBS 10737 TaxID=1296096 RepID=A0A1B9I2Y5_9TREE|nr:uncharacterized protein I206_04392 [Kwoniella pini CBS 10737]OCF49865.1 hypothetical protein I206_04392 [Kwoniella pini CBS 10737]
MVNDTERLLSEIECSTGAELAMLVRYNTFPPGPTFIRPLDQLILGGRPHPGQSTMMRGDLIELIGASGSGKTTFITHLIFTTILSSNIPDFLLTPLGGKQLKVTLIIPKSHNLFKIINNIKLSIKNHILNIKPNESEKMINQIIKESLSRLKIYQIKSRFKELALILKKILYNTVNLPRGISSNLENQEELVKKNELDLLIIEGIGDSLYPTRWNEEQKNQNYNHNTFKNNKIIINSDQIGLKQIFDCINQIRKEIGSIIIMSNQGLRASKESKSFFQNNLSYPYPSPWSSSASSLSLNQENFEMYWPLNIQITFSGKTQKGLQYPSETYLSDILQQQLNLKKKESKSNVVEIYECIVRMIGCTTGSVSTKAGGKFRFGINDGILIDISGD